MVSRFTHHVRQKWMIWYAVALHAAWGGLLLFEEEPLWVTCINEFNFLPHWVVGILFITIAVMAARALMYPNRVNLIIHLAPQQVILMISAARATQAAFEQSFADGVIRPWSFILADQLPAILAALLHTLALIDIHGFQRNGK